MLNRTIKNVIESPVYLAVLLSLPAILLSSYIAAVVGAVIFAIILLLLKKNAVIPVIIIGLTALTGPEIEKYRNYVSLVLISFLTFLYFYEYGINIKVELPSLFKWFILLYFAALTISSTFSNDPWIGYASVLRSAVFFLICFILLRFITGKVIIYNYISALFLIVIAVGSTVIYDLISSGLTAYFVSGVVTRFSGVYGNPNYVGMLIIITMPLTIVLLRNFRDKPYVKLLLLLFLLFEIIVLILSNSRASMFGTFVAVFFTLAFLYRTMLIRLMAGFVILIALLISLYPQIISFGEMFLRIDRVNNREMFWNAGVDIIADYPWLGTGADTFDKTFYSYMPSYGNDMFHSGNWKAGRPHPHNLFLYYWAENGVTGFATAVFFFASFFALCYQTAKLSGSKNLYELYNIVIGITAVGIGMFIRSFYEITGLITYGFITRDLPFWICYTILIWIYLRVRNFDASAELERKS